MSPDLLGDQLELFAQLSGNWICSGKGTVMSQENVPHWNNKVGRERERETSRGDMRLIER